MAARRPYWLGGINGKFLRLKRENTNLWPENLVDQPVGEAAGLGSSEMASASPRAVVNIIVR